MFDASTEYKSPDIVGEICTFEFDEDCVYDCAIASEVLEHLRAPHEAIRRLH